MIMKSCSCLLLLLAMSTNTPARQENTTASGRQNDERASTLAQPWIRIAYNSDRLDRRVAKQQAFDFNYRNVFASTDDDVFRSPGDTDITVSVDPREVSGVEPVIGVVAV